MCSRLGSLSLLLLFVTGQAAFAGPYDEPGHPIASGVAWADTVESIDRGPIDILDPDLGDATAGLPAYALGPATGDPADTVSLGDGGSIELLAEAFNVLNNENLFTNPNTNGVVPAVLDRAPQVGDCYNPNGCGANNQGSYRFPNQISPGSTPFAVQLGARLRF